MISNDQELIQSDTFYRYCSKEQFKLLCVNVNKDHLSISVFMYVSIKACHDCEKIMNNLWPFNLLAIFHLQIAM